MLKTFNNPSIAFFRKTNILLQLKLKIVNSISFTETPDFLKIVSVKNK